MGGWEDKVGLEHLEPGPLFPVNGERSNQGGLVDQKPGFCNTRICQVFGLPRDAQTTLLIIWPQARNFWLRNSSSLQNSARKGQSHKEISLVFLRTRLPFSLQET